MTWRVEDLPSPPEGKAGWPWTEGSSPTSGGVPICIVTPSFNQGQFIEETIRSVLLQGVDNLRYVVRDGGSTDQTRAILAKYAPFCAEVVIGPDDGQSAVINEVLFAAGEPVVGWLNSDDVLMPGALAAVQKAWAAKPFTTLLGQSEYRREDGVTVIWHVEKAPTNQPSLFRYNRALYVAQPSTFFTSNAFRDVGGLDLSLRYTMDLDLWFRLLAVEDATFLPVRLSWMRSHSNAKTANSGAALLQEVESVYERYDPHWRTTHPLEAVASKKNQAGPSLYRRARAFVRRALLTATQDG